MKKLWLELTILILASYFLAIKGFDQIQSFDIFWHLRLGLDFLQKGQLPIVDYYSFAFSGHKYQYALPVLFELVAAGFYKFFGHMGLHLLKACCLVFPLSVFYWTMTKQNISNHIKWIGLLILFNALMYRGFLRPECFSYFFEILSIYFCFQLLNNFCLKNVLKILLVHLVWTNVHGTVIFNYVILFGFLTEILIKNYSSKQFYIKIFLTGAAALIIGFLNLYGKHALIGVFSVNEQWMSFVNELGTLPKTFFVYPLAVTLGIVAMIIFCRDKFWPGIIITFIFAVKTFEMNKVLPHSMIILSCLLIPCLNKLSYDLNFNKLLEKKLYLIIALLISLGSGFEIYHYGFFKIPPHMNDTMTRYPKEVTDYLKTKDYQGNLFNVYGHGGYLMQYLSDKYKIYIDGRTNILYPYSYASTYLEKLSSPQKLRKEMKKYNVKYAVAPLFLYDYVIDNLFRSNLFKLEYIGKFSAFFSTETNLYPLSTKLFARPGCLRDIHLPGLIRENNRALEDHQSGDLLPRLNRNAINYLQSSEKNMFFYNYRLPKDFHLYDVRFIASLLANDKHWLRALAYYDKIPLEMLIYTDVLFIASMLLEGEDRLTKVAEKHLMAVEKFIKRFSARELATYYKLIKKASASTSSKYFIKKEVDKFYLIHKKRIDSALDVESSKFFNYRCNKNSDFKDERGDS